MIDTIFVRSPLRFLDDTIIQNRFFEGVVVSVIYLQHFGAERLKEHFKSKGIPTGPMRIEKLGLPAIGEMLEGFGIIDHHTHCLIGEVNQERNQIVHQLLHPDAMDEAKAMTTIQKAIECLKALGMT